MGKYMWGVRDCQTGRVVWCRTAKEMRSLMARWLKEEPLAHLVSVYN